MKRWNLNRVVTHAVQYALISGLSSCSTTSTGDGDPTQADPLSEPKDDDETVDTGDDQDTDGAASDGGAGDDDDPRPQDGRTDELTDDGAPLTDDPDPVDDDGVSDTGGDDEATDALDDAGAMTDAATDDDTVTDGGLRPSDSAPLECSGDGDSIFDEMQLTSSYDSIALRVTGEELLETPLEETESSGEHCAGASDADACLTEADAAWPTADSEWLRCGQIGCSYYGVLTTQGDDVALAESLDAIAALLGPIDTPHEASLWAQANGYDASCAGTSHRSTADGILLDFEHMISECPVTYAELSLLVAPDGSLKEVSRVVLPDTGVCIGRRPPGMLGVNAPCSGHEVGDYFAGVAALEKAAVEAFDVIRSDLARFDAPERLLRLAERAQQDEQRHALQMTELAVRYGARPGEHRSEGRKPQSLLELALDNAVEGCVRETFGAAYAAFQALKARDPKVRETLRQIAVDETRHAELSFQIHSWVETQLPPEQRAELASAMKAAVAKLRAEVAHAQPVAVRVLAGAPSPADAVALLDDLEAQLWAPALAA